MNCKLCGNKMKELFTSTYCDCEELKCDEIGFPMFPTGAASIIEANSVKTSSFSPIIINELVKVQPMSLPSGLLFYLDYRFDTVE